MRNIMSTLAVAALGLAPLAQAFELSSPDFKPGQALSKAQEFNSFGCQGGNLSPALNWSAPPAGTKSLALTVYDPDAPTGSGWWHWVVFNLPASARGLPGGIGHGASLPAGAVQSRTDYGQPGFGGACPPQGDKPHRYIFTVHALKTDKLELGPDAMPALVGFMLHANELGRATLTGYYGRP